jgi:hypothetical protein
MSNNWIKIVNLIKDGLILRPEVFNIIKLLEKRWEKASKMRKLMMKIFPFDDIAKLNFLELLMNLVAIWPCISYFCIILITLINIQATKIALKISISH